MSVDGRNVLLAGPRLQLWRAPTDNDGLRLLPDRRSGVLWRWLELGLDRLEQRLDSFRVTRSGIEAVHRASGRGDWRDATHRQSLPAARHGRPAGRERGSSRAGAPRPAARRRRARARAGARAARVVRAPGRGRATPTGVRPRSSDASAARSRSSTCRTSSRRSTDTGATCGRSRSPTATGFGLDGRGPPDARFHGEPLHRGRPLRRAPHLRPRAPRRRHAQPRPRPARPRHRELRPRHGTAVPASRARLPVRLRADAECVPPRVVRLVAELSSRHAESSVSNSRATPRASAMRGSHRPILRPALACSPEQAGRSHRVCRRITRG